jgi:glycolate oxidase iron-sulfur subunit
MTSSTPLDKIAARCADCATCLSACPVYALEKREPDSPRGRINLMKALSDGRLRDTRAVREFLDRCLLCGSCQGACPAQVEYIALMTGARCRRVEHRGLPLLKRLMLEGMRPFPLKSVRNLAGLLTRTPLKRFFPFRRRQPVAPVAAPKTTTETDVLLFPGCVADHLAPELKSGVINLLQRLGFSVSVPEGLVCCGFPHLAQGWQRRFDRLRRRNTRVLAGHPFRWLVAPCATCVAALRNHYDFPAGTEIYELGDFLFRFRPDAPVNPEFASSLRVTYHDPCHARHELKLGREPRHFLHRLGPRFIDDASNLCCGFAGSFRAAHPGLSKRILERRASRLREIGAEAVVTSCPGCYMQLGAGLDIPVHFITDIFA